MTKDAIKKTDNINQEWKNFLCPGLVGRSMISGRIEPMNIGKVEIDRINVKRRY